MEILNKIQKELKAPKGQKNTFQGYMYRSCEDILEAVKPLLGEATLTLSDEMIMLGDRFYVKATATISDKTDDISVSAYAREEEKRVNKEGKSIMDASQITGSASSYARKYALNGLFCIDDTKDADTQDNTKEEVNPIQKVSIPKTLTDKLAQADTQEKLTQFCAWFMSNEKLTQTQKDELHLLAIEHKKTIK